MIKKLLKEISTSSSKIYIQTHDFPDPDAIASAFGLQAYLKINKIKAQIVYAGEIQRTALNNMISDLNMDLKNSKETDISPRDLIIIVDGCKGNKNITDLPGYEIAVIDHHMVKEPDDVPYIQIDDKIGSCSTLITEYFIHDNLSIPKPVATALMVGLSRDTDMLTRKVSPRDMDAYYYLFKFANNNLVHTFLRNNIQISDFSFFSYAINHLKRRGSFAWCYFPRGCSTNLMGIIGDFLLSANEIKFVAIFSNNNNVLSFSLRNELENISAARISREITKNIGAGGGHREMSGGVIFNPQDINIEDVANRIGDRIAELD